jgi:hypothetical protein
LAPKRLLVFFSVMQFYHPVGDSLIRLRKTVIAEIAANHKGTDS